MKKITKYILSMLIFMISFICFQENVKAESYTINLVPYNVTNSCDLEEEGGQACFEKFLAGELSSNLITDGHVAANDNLMIIVEINPSSDATATTYTYQLDWDTSKVDYYQSSYGPEYGFLDGSLGYDYSFFPTKTSGRNTYKNWLGIEPIISPGLDYANNMIKDGSANATQITPLVKKTYANAFFFTVKSDIQPGSEFDFWFDSNPAYTALANANYQDITKKATFNKVRLSVLSDMSRDGTLKKLTATGNNGLNYPFGFIPSNSSKLEYDFIVPNAVDKITFSGEATDPNNKGIVGLTTHNLNVGDNTINISIIAESTDTTMYKIKVRRLSNNATLSSITGTNGVSFGTLSPTNFTYSTTVPYITASTTITATATHSGAIVDNTTIGNWTIATDNQTNKKNTYNVDVSAEDCKYDITEVPGNICTTQRYTFEITRTAPSKDLTLSDLKVDGKTIPGFSPSVKEYTLANAPADKNSINITATLSDSKNSITSGTGVKTVQVGDNKYEIIVTSEDGITTDKYTINLHKLSAENRLQTLSVTSNPSGTLSPNFNSDLYSPTGEYTYTYDPNVTTITFSATVKDTGKAYIKIVDANNASNASNTTFTLNSSTTTFDNKTTKVNVIVKAENETEKTYVVNLVRQKSTNNYLSSLSITPGVIIESFNPTTGTYNAVVEPNVTSVTVNAVLADPNNAHLGTITGNTNFNFGTGNIISIPVISEDDHTNTYTINVTRKEYDIATLDEIRVGYGTATPTRIAGFNKDTLIYNLNVKDVNAVPYNVSSIKIEYDKSNEYSIVTGDTGTKTLNTGDNVFTINVESQDHSETKSYVLNIYRDKNNDNETKGVTVAGVAATLVPGTDNIYEVTLGNDKTSILPSEVIISKAEGATVIKPTSSLPLSTKNVNDYHYTIVSEDGVSKEYVIHITREKSKNANITRVDLNIPGDSTPRYCVFNESETACTIQVPTATSKYTLTATIDPEATISPANGTEYTMTSAASDSVQKRELVVTAENDNSKTYTITVERIKSADANLSGITLTNVTNGKNEPISFSNFQENKTSYNITVPATVEDIRIAATLKDPKAKITTNLDNPFTLKFGLNQITIDVTAEDGTTTKPYTLNITRSKGIDTLLQDLKVENATISGFIPSSTSYIYSSVDYTTTSLAIEGTTKDPNAKISEIIVNGKSVPITSANNVATSVDLSTGTNTIIVRVKAHDETINSRDYTITVDRDTNTNNSINGIKFKKKDGTFITATVDPNNSSKYIVTVPNDETVANSDNVIVDLPEGVLPTDPKASIVMSSTNLVTNDPITGNVNSHTFTVVSESGSAKNYTLEITREKNNNVDLTRVYAYSGDSTTYDSFCENISTSVVCKLTVPVSTTSFRLEGILPVTTSTVVFKEDGVVKTTFDMSSTQSGSTKNIIAVVTAENGDTQEYNITVERTLSSNSALKKLETDADNEGVLSSITGYTDTKTSYELNLTANPFTQDTFKINIAAYDSKSKIINITSTGVINKITQDTSDVALIELNLNAAGQSTTIDFTVEAENGNQVPYLIKVNRPKNVEPRLSKITINNVDINNYLTGTTFDNDSSKDIENTVYNYDLDFSKLYSESSNEADKTLLPYSHHTLTIVGTSMDTLNGKVRNNGPFQIQTINYEGNTNYINQIKLISCAHNDSVCKTYTLNIRRQSNSSTNLYDWDTAVKVKYKDAGALEETLHTATYDRTQSAGTNNRVYTITVPNSVTEINKDNLFVDVEDGVTEWDQLATVVVQTTQLSTKTKPNIVNFTVVAEDGTIETYTLQVTRSESDFAALSSLSIVNPETNQVIGTFTRNFVENSNIDAEYTINIPEGTTSYKIVATASDGGTVTGDGTFNMSSSTEQRIVYAHSENGLSTTSYTLNITRSSNDNKNLLSLEVLDKEGNPYTITPDVRNPEGQFSGIYDYNVTVPGNVDKIILNATPESSLAQGVIYLSADAGTTNTYSVSVGENTIRFKIRSEAGNEQSYTLKVVREQKSENRLKTLEYTLSDGTTKSIILEDNKFDYTIDNVENDITTITFVATKMDNDETITGLGQQAIATGPNIFTIKVTAQNGDEQNYTVSVNRAKSSDARLKIFSLTGSTFNEDFELGENNIEKVVYTVTVPETKDKVGQNDITAIPNHSKATVSYDPEITLSTSGINIYGVIVKAEDGREKRYELRITRPKSTDATLKSIELEGATIQPDFDPKTNEYTIKVPVGSPSFTITGIPNVDTATVIGNGTHSLSENSFNIMVQAEDENVPINTYKFNIVEAKSTDATLGSLSVQGYQLNPSFVKTTTTYSIGNIENSVSQVLINAVPSNINSTVEYYSDGELVATCESKTKCTVPLKTGLGTKYLSVKVIAPDGIAHKEYNISYTKVNSNDAFLDNIIADVGTFDNAFNQATLNYTLKIPYDKDSVNLTITTNHANASIKVNADEPVYSPKVYNVTNVPENGSKTITILVTAEDGTTTKTYNVVIEREAYTGSNDAFLSDLFVTGYNFTESFNPNKPDYSIGQIPYATPTLTINATPNVEGSTIEYFVNGVKQTSNVVSIPKENATVTVKVTAGDRTTVKTYTIDFTKVGNTDASLTNIIPSKGTLTPTFNSNKYSYDIELSEEEDSIDLTAIAADSNATITINGENYVSNRLYSLTNLPDGKTQVTIIVTAEDGATKLTYQVNILRNSSNEVITSFAYGHDISDGYIKTVAALIKVSDMKDQLDNDNAKLEVWNALDDTKLADDTVVGTGMIVKLVINGTVTDSKVIVVKGDVNGDSEINVIDASAIVNYFLGRSTLTGAYLLASDVNVDTEVNVIDASAIINHFLDRTPIKFK